MTLTLNGIRPEYSILTPTFNRAEVLHRPYESLKRQTVQQGFEWIVIDDGSTDHTADLIRHWQSEASFPLTLLSYKNNRGRNAAVNTGLELASGKYTLILDSDDELLDNALQTVAQWRHATGIDTSPQVYKLLFRCVDSRGNIVGRESLSCGTRSPKEVLQLSFQEAYHSWGLPSEMIGVGKTSIIQTAKYVELTNSEHCAPSVTHHRVSGPYDCVFVDHAIRRYHLGDGIARLSDKSSTTIKWPRGKYLRARERLNCDIKYSWQNPKLFLRAGRRMVRLGFHIRRPLFWQFRDLVGVYARLIWLLGLTRGYIGYLRDRQRGIRSAVVADRKIERWGPAVMPNEPVLCLPRQGLDPVQSHPYVSRRTPLSIE